jgi:hypothetical protein
VPALTVLMLIDCFNCGTPKVSTLPGSMHHSGVGVPATGITAVSAGPTEINTGLVPVLTIRTCAGHCGTPGLAAGPNGKVNVVVRAVPGVALVTTATVGVCGVKAVLPDTYFTDFAVFKGPKRCFVPTGRIMAISAAISGAGPFMSAQAPFGLTMGEGLGR